MLAALIVGALTAWYLGLRAGVIAAVATAGALLIAQFVPGLTVTVYALVVAWSAGVYFLGARFAQTGSTPTWWSAATGQASAWLRKVMGSNRS